MPGYRYGIAKHRPPTKTPLEINLPTNPIELRDKAVSKALGSLTDSADPFAQPYLDRNDVLPLILKSQISSEAQGNLLESLDRSVVTSDVSWLF